MNKISFPLAFSMAIVFLVVGLAGGYYISPFYQKNMYVKEERGLGQADRFVDLRYINQMAAHHRGAILLANQIADKTPRDEVKHLALEIGVNEPKLINELYSWKRDWFNDSTTINDPIIANFGPSDEKIDLRFLNALIAHHQAGIEMTNEIRTKSSRAEILDNADSVENFLKNSLVTLNGWREQWYNVK